MGLSDELLFHKKSLKMNINKHEVCFQNFTITKNGYLFLPKWTFKWVWVLMLHGTPSSKPNLSTVPQEYLTTWVILWLHQVSSSFNSFVHEWLFVYWWIMNNINMMYSICICQTYQTVHVTNSIFSETNQQLFIYKASQ